MLRQWRFQTPTIEGRVESVLEGDREWRESIQVCFRNRTINRHMFFATPNVYDSVLRLRSDSPI